MALQEVRLCSACVEVLQKPHTRLLQKQDYNQYKHQTSLESLWTSVQIRCPICTWLLMLVYCREDTPDRQHEGSQEQLSFHSTGSILHPWLPPNPPESFTAAAISTLSVHRWRRGAYLPLASRKLFPSPSDSYEAEFRVRGLHYSKKNRLCVRLEPLPTASQQLSDNVGENTQSEQTISTVNQWLRRCEAEHQCLLEADTSWRPDRLIYVYEDFDGSVCARILEARLEEYEPGVKYATLSHRWLADDMLRLEVKTLSAFRAQIPLARAKTAVKDAMQVAVKLDVQFIWIDSLCILQDDKADVGRQISLMDKIFANSHFTIAAANADAREKSLFSERDTRTIRSYYTKQDFCEGADDGPTAHMIRLDWNEFEDHPRHSILSERAWIYQERFLSHRTLHYSSQQVYWQCHEMEASETYPEGMPLGAKQLTRPVASDEDIEPLEPAIEITHAKRLRQSALDNAMAQIWYLIVQEYSARSMTVRGDRLRALDGVADYCRKYLKGDDQYLFGIWQSMLPRALCWSSEGIRQHELEDVAPSWSWASVSRMVHFPYHLSRPLAGRHAVDIVKVVDVAAGSSESTITPKIAPDERQHRLLRLRGYLLEPSRVRGPDQESNRAQFTRLFPSSFGILNYREDLDEDVSPHEVIHFCLPIFRTSAYGSIEEYGLTVTSVPMVDAPEIPTYRRMGTYEVRSNREVCYGDQDELRDLYLC